MKTKRLARITEATIDPGEVLSLVKDDSAGGIAMFIGTIRNRNEGKSVDRIEYEVYKKMAEKRILEIEAKARKRWPVTKIFAVHRRGELEVGEVSVVVAVSSEHRADAFEACRYAIDAMKHSLPFWKKESSKGRTRWVKGTPIARRPLLRH